MMACVANPATCTVGNVAKIYGRESIMKYSEAGLKLGVGVLLYITYHSSHHLPLPP